MKMSFDATARIDTTHFGIAEIWYKAVGAYAVAEGDIVLGSVYALRDQTATVKVGAVWPGGKVPYTIDDGLPDPKRVTDAIASWQAKTSLTFVVRTDEPDYVTFRDGVGCSSRLGRVGGQQFVSLGAQCTAGNAIHEIGHTLGLWHEHSRADRDEAIAVHLEHVEAGFEHAFDVRINQAASHYNWGSIMHYPLTAFSSDGEPTIECKRDGVFATIGQREKLSPGDWLVLGLLYCDLEPTYPCVIPAR